MKEIGQKLDEHTLEQLEESVGRVEEIKKKERVDLEEVRRAVKTANYWIEDTALDLETGEFDEELYETYRYRILLTRGSVSIVQGLEVDPTTGRYVK